MLALAVGAATVVLVLFAVPLWVLEQRAAAADLEEAATDAARGVADYISAGGTGSKYEPCDRLGVFFQIEVRVHRVPVDGNGI